MSFVERSSLSQSVPYQRFHCTHMHRQCYIVEMRKKGGVVRVCMRVHKSKCARRKPLKKNEWNKWKNHFYEMKGDVGMSLHEKERNKKMPTPRHKVTHNPIPTSLFLPRLQRTFSCRQLDVKMLCSAVCFAYIMHS